MDLDFPSCSAPWRARRRDQAAGRCNREGGSEPGGSSSLHPRRTPAWGAYRAGAGITGALLGRGDVEPHAAAGAAAYFQQLFQTIATDRAGIQGLRRGLDFPEVARRFRMIADDSESMVVRYGPEEERRRTGRLLDALRAHAGARRVLRDLQPYIVSVHRRDAGAGAGEHKSPRWRRGWSGWASRPGARAGRRGPRAESLIVWQ